MSRRGSDVLAAVLADSHLLPPDELPRLLADHVALLGARDVALYLADADQRVLVPMPLEKGAVRHEVPIEGTVAGRCFRGLDVQEVGIAGGGRRLWVPVIDGTERLGVVELVFDAGEGNDVEGLLPAFAALVAALVMCKRAYGDAVELVRRREPMSLASELLWQLLPPLTFGSERVVIAAMLAPIYDLGGDAFDYSVDTDRLQFAVFDAMGHGLPAGISATVAIAAYRNARRQELGLAETLSFIDDAIAGHVGDHSYVTAVLAELDLPSGRLRWCTAGHPRPLVLRRGHIVKSLEAGVTVPLGLGVRPHVGEEVLEPDDRVLLYTDGIIEARSASGELFGLERFADLVKLASSERTPPPETMRRLMHAVIDHQFGELRDDATALLVQWPGNAVEELLVDGADAD